MESAPELVFRYGRVAVNTDEQVVTCFNTTLTGKAKIDM